MAFGVFRVEPGMLMVCQGGTRVKIVEGGRVFGYTFLTPPKQMDDGVLYLHLSMKNDWENSTAWGTGQMEIN